MSRVKENTSDISGESNTLRALTCLESRLNMSATSAVSQPILLRGFARIVELLRCVPKVDFGSVQGTRRLSPNITCSK
jgi:hypothetical protein